MMKSQQEAMNLQQEAISKITEKIKLQKQWQKAIA